MHVLTVCHVVKRRGTFELDNSQLQEVHKNKTGVTDEGSGQTEKGICDDELANKLAESLQATTREEAEQGICQESKGRLRKTLNYVKNNKMVSGKNLLSSKECTVHNYVEHNFSGNTEYRVHAI